MSSPAASRTTGSTAGLGTFIRALWGADVSVEPLPNLAGAEVDAVDRRPRFAGSRIWVPSEPLPGSPRTYSEYLLAAVAHAAAHVYFGGLRFEVKGLKPPQIAIISLLEDARVERLAAARYPGLTRLWTPFHTARSDGAKTSQALLARLARALHDGRYADEDAWVAKARAHFDDPRFDWRDSSCLRELGGALGNDLGQMRAQFEAKNYAVMPIYRDDNFGLWQSKSAEDAAATEADMARGSDLDQADVDSDRDKERPAAGVPRPHMTCERAPSLRSGAASRCEVVGEPPKNHSDALSPTRYPEWDYVIARERDEFCSLRERGLELGDTERLDDALAGYRPARQRLGRFARRLADRRAVHIRRLLDGDRLDLASAVENLVAQSTGTFPEQRVYRRVRVQQEPPVLLLLIDLSESLNRAARAHGTTLLELARNASVLLAGSLPSAAPDLAIHGFSSNGRHDVGYYRFKDFGEPYDALVHSRLAGMKASFSTRFGPALRHAGRVLHQRSARRKLLLLVTDGEPSDVDVYDPNYLVLDAKRATNQNRARGVQSFCIGLDSSAETSVTRIFGTGNWVMLEHLRRLPECLCEVYLRLSA